MKKPSKKKLLQMAESTGGVVLDMAEQCKVPRSTMYNWINKDQDLKDAIENGRDILVDMAKKGLREKLAAGSEKSIIYVLGTLGRKEGFGNVIQIQDKSKLEDQMDGMTDEEIMAEMEDSRRRIGKAAK